jgi:solute carrier family 35 protein F5
VCVCNCSIPANTAIYQAACVWVFLFSIFLLRERVTVIKIVAVVVSVVGVVLVAVFSTSGSCHSSSSATSNHTSPVNSTHSLWSLEDPDPAANLHHSPELGHIHRGGSCTEKSTFSGYIALFYSVISYAVFEVGYKKWGSEEGDPASVANSLRFLGYLGINTLAWLWPGFLILHYSGVEPFEWPPYDIFILLLWNALLDIVFNAGLLICIALSSALFARYH